MNTASASRTSRSNDNEGHLYRASGSPILVPNSIVAVARWLKIWMYKVQFQDSFIPMTLYDQIYIGGRPAHEFAHSILRVENDYYHIKWNTHWIPDVPEELKLQLCKQLGGRFLALAMSDDDLIWRAETCMHVTMQDSDGAQWTLDLDHASQ